MLYIAKVFKAFNLIFSAFVGSAVYTALPLPTIPACNVYGIDVVKKSFAIF